MKILYSILPLFALILLTASCGDTDSEDKICLESEILIENRCDGNILISYFELDDGFDIIDEILNLDGCDIAEKTKTISPGSSIEVTVFEGACFMNSEPGPDRCMDYISDETIAVQYGNAVKEYPIYKREHIVIIPTQFD
jgi:hypothetical protein